ncbi:hypothetical protein FQR65_LT13702 [Abscondita terminalis]|nr:hypothetical protein FQR65_LT13702 [Abscondita terminalis]
MNNLTNRVYKSIVDNILNFALEKIPKEQAKLFTAFAKQYYAHTDLETLESRSAENLAAALASHWSLVYQRLPGKANIRVFNPSFEKDGWESKYSIVQIVAEDKPFLVDSTRMEINRQGFNIFFNIHFGNIKLRRDKQGKVIEILPYDAVGDHQTEALIYLEIDKNSDTEILNKLAKKLEKVLAQVSLVVNDWPEMRSRMQSCLKELEQNSPPYDPEDVAESKDFLVWLLNDHFTFLGCRDYDLSKDHKTLRMIKKSGLGVLRDETRSKAEKPLTELPPEARRLAFSPQVLVISKTNSKSRVHRSVYADYIGVKRFNAQGELIGERRFIGLYTSTVYHSDPRSIPLIRRKIQLILQNSNLPLKGHAGKALLDILSSLPRDDLFQASVKELTQLALGILHIQEQRTVRLFVRQDNYRRFISCLVYLPKEQLNTDLQRQMEKILVREFSELPPEARRLAFSPQVLVISKTNSKSRVHRSVYADYIGVKRFNAQGELIGERRFIGLYTSTVYHSDPRSIPLIRRKIQLILQNSNLPLKGHAGKALLDILSSLPRDDLFQASVKELTQLALGILHIQEQRTVRLFVRQDNYRRFISCLVYLPKEQLNTDLQRQMEKILVREFSGIEIGFSTLFGDSNLARIHFLIRTDPKKDLTYDVKKIESQLVEVARSWKQELRQA